MLQYKSTAQKALLGIDLTLKQFFEIEFQVWNSKFLDQADLKVTEIHWQRINGISHYIWIDLDILRTGATDMSKRNDFQNKILCTLERTSTGQAKVLLVLKQNKTKQSKTPVSAH
jgi:hypothetical protein